jgi:hypothetical protein
MPRHTSRPHRTDARTPTPRAAHTTARALIVTAITRPARPDCGSPECHHPADLHVPAEATGQPCGARRPGQQTRCPCNAYSRQTTHA